MQRFGEARELTFAIPERSWMYSFKEPFNHTMIRCPSLTLCFKNFLTNFKYVSLFQIFQQTSLGSTWLRPICLPQVHPPTHHNELNPQFPQKSSEKFEESTHSCKFYFLFRDDCFSSGNFLNLSSNLSSVWNYNEVKKVLPSAVYITLLR